jgi:nicotinate-nucleotide adenylyltransferase
VSNVTTRTLGIMGGTFDPPHIGHLIGAEEARSRLGLEEVIFVPNGRPPHKEGMVFSEAKHRYVMTILATLENPYFSVSRIEIDKQGPGYTVDLLKMFKEEYGDSTELVFIIGSDALLELKTWKDPEQVLRLCKMAAVTRPNSSMSVLEKRLGALYRNNQDRFILLDIPEVEVSSREIRERIRQNKSIRYLVPSLVYDYIMRNQLYY